MKQPVIGITCDTVAGHSPQRWKYESPFEYSRAVSEAGGVPLLMPYEVGRIGDYLRLCDGVLLTGGDDADTTVYGEPLHPMSKLMHAQRQAFEAALLKALDTTRHPVLGICMGMQMMALHAGGKLHQHLPDAPDFGAERAACHLQNIHRIEPTLPHPHLPGGGTVHSKHHQAVADPGKLRCIAMGEGVIEAVDRPDGSGRFYLGVQWHPERTADPEMGMGIIRRFVEACRG